MTREEKKAYLKEYYQSHKEECKAYYQAHKEERKEYMKEERKEYMKEYLKAWNAANKDRTRAYMQSDVNSLGQTKNSIRFASRALLKKINLKIPEYEIHHCFGYDDPSKFIYISKSLHLKIHQFLCDNNIDADSDHWMAIRDIVNSADEFMYIKC